MILSPQFLDILGAIGFVVIIAIAVYGLTHDNRVPRFLLLLLLIIGLVGLLVDLSIVFYFFV